MWLRIPSTTFSVSKRPRPKWRSRPHTGGSSSSSIPTSAGTITSSARCGTPTKRSLTPTSALRTTPIRTEQARPAPTTMPRSRGGGVPTSNHGSHRRSAHLPGSTRRVPTDRTNRNRIHPARRPAAPPRNVRRRKAASSSCGGTRGSSWLPSPYSLRCSTERSPQSFSCWDSSRRWGHAAPLASELSPAVDTSRSTPWTERRSSATSIR